MHRGAQMMETGGQIGVSIPVLKPKTLRGQVVFGIGMLRFPRSHQVIPLLGSIKPQSKMPGVLRLRPPSQHRAPMNQATAHRVSLRNTSIMKESVSTPVRCLP